MRKVSGIDSSTDRKALMSFKSLVSDPHNALSGWNISSSHCTWFGVNCTSNATKVQSLNLANLGLFGIIPPQLSNLTSLKTLDLSNNSFFGQIPSELAHLTSLQHIILAANFINGTIPISLSHCLKLEHIVFDNNKLTGHLPSELGQLSRLKLLDVSMNNLTGAIPSTFGNLSTLTILNIARTQMSGEIPNELGRLHNLVVLQLSENEFSGEIPFSIFNMSSLKFLSLTQNRLVGKLPANLGHSLPNIRELHLARNGLEGPIPTSLSNASHIEFLDLTSNNFTGHIPLLGNLKHLVKLFLGGNSLSSTTELNFQLFDSLTNCTLLSEILLYSNQLAGKLPSSVANLSASLQEICFYDNFLTGSFPQGLEKYQNLVSLSIEKNSFKGKIPNSIGKLQKLERLMVNDNQFSGEIPDIFSNLTRLYQLYMGNNQLSGRIPMSLATCQQLKKLGLAHSGLNGSIPKQIFELPNLYFLQLANNSLIGSLPDRFGDLRQLEVMDISGNQLSGNIPNISQRFSSLLSLNIARNKITGSIPKSLENLAALVLNLSFNSLEGEVPKNGVFANISWDSLQGNYRLCAFDHVAAEEAKKLLLVSHKRKSNSPLVLKVTIPILCLHCASCNKWVCHKKFDRVKEHLGSVYRAVFNTGENGHPHHSCSEALIIQGAEFKALAMEFMSNGNLDKWLYPEDVECGLTLSLTQRLNIAIDVASALDYLHHDCDPPVVHCDLKPGNNESSTIGLKGSIGYIAPEYGLGGKASTSGDVYSFGILLLEMIIAKKPTDQMFQEGLSLNKFISEVHESKIFDIADPRLLKDNESLARSCSTSYSTDEDVSSKNKNNNNNIALRVEECVAEMVRVGLSCAASSSKDRFIMREALSKLQEIKRCFIGL
uniref:non-specific serine/threonine protein kinase n=1 Tax=Fagus sylvatica TaxID=28930 RepID=A0A2N9HWF3_FAGSY